MFSNVPSPLARATVIVEPQVMPHVSVLDVGHHEVRNAVRRDVADRDAVSG